MRKILGIDIGGSKLLTAVCDFTESEDFIPGKIAKRVLKPDCTKEILLHEIRSTLEELDAFGSFSAVGVTIPGLADPENGIWVYACFSGIGNFPIVEELRKFLGDCPIRIENDVNACAYAEKKFGLARNIDDFLWVTISNGIGGGLVLNGKIYSGYFGNAGEIGHFNVVENGRLCECGNRGCLEAEAAGPGIALRYREKFQPDSNATALEIAEMARNGDSEAIEVYETTGKLLGKAMAYAANLINPSMIVIGGGVSGAFDLFYPSMQAEFVEKSFKAANRGVRIEKTALGYEAGLAGAVSLTLE